ncbi:HLA class I histocompatibility antigen, B alpha chain-like [Ahaetulla prasina]|uniref:HLA class I histocompatibility antigen, B alpha chain-like n=1 Tax=Ahaetulla prasina TaxID=499056 RepID=UPI00264809CF|nr:HLA class I histocompatibility antigen, B alpha chain-like [Ahaetulla prasina]
MALRSLARSLLLLVAVALRERCFGASSHSMKFFYTGISEPSQGQPHFVALGFVDDQLFSSYDSNSRKRQPRVSWMEKVGKEDPQYWDRNTQVLRGIEELFREGLETLRSRYNQSEELLSLAGSRASSFAQSNIGDKGRIEAGMRELNGPKKTPDDSASIQVDQPLPKPRPRDGCLQCTEAVQPSY